jgi:DNA-binding PadR family transcriptional regulator
MTAIRRRGRAIRAAEAPQVDATDHAVSDGSEASAALALARELYLGRRRRARFLSADLFGEPTWDILLDLYVSAREGRRVPTTSACIGAHVPPTTALRWLRILETRGLVEREGDGRDGRRTFVRLSDKGLAAMDAFFRATLASVGSAMGEVLSQLNDEQASEQYAAQ